MKRPYLPPDASDPVIKWTCYHPHAALVDCASASASCGDVEPHWTATTPHWRYDIFRIVNESGWKHELHGTALFPTAPENGQICHPFATLKEAMQAAARNDDETR